MNEPNLNELAKHIKDSLRGVVACSAQSDQQEAAMRDAIADLKAQLNNPTLPTQDRKEVEFAIAQAEGALELSRLISDFLIPSHDEEKEAEWAGLDDAASEKKAKEEFDKWIADLYAVQNRLNQMKHP